MRTSQWFTLESGIRGLHTTRGRHNVPEVGDEIGAENLEESEPVDRQAKSAEPKHDTDVGDDDLTTLVLAEHH